MTMNLPTLLPQFLCSVAETVLNKVIQLDPAAHASLLQLQGRQLAFELTDLHLRLVFTAQPNGIWLNQHQEPVDCVVKTTVASVQQLRDPSQITRLIRENALDIEGDLQQLQKFSQFFSKLQPDWAHALSRYVGDAVAHNMARSLSHLMQAIQQQLALSEQNFTELMQDELQVTPVAAEVEQFSQQVSQLSARTDKLLMQFSQLKEK